MLCLDVIAHGSAVATGGFGGLRPPNKAPNPPKLKYEALQISGIFVKFESQAPRIKLKPPYLRLSSDGSDLYLKEAKLRWHLE